MADTTDMLNSAGLLGALPLAFGSGKRDRDHGGWTANPRGRKYLKKQHPFRRNGDRVTALDQSEPPPQSATGPFLASVGFAFESMLEWDKKALCYNECDDEQWHPVLSGSILDDGLTVRAAFVGGNERIVPFSWFRSPLGSPPKKQFAWPASALVEHNVNAPAMVYREKHQSDEDKRTGEVLLDKAILSWQHSFLQDGLSQLSPVMKENRHHAEWTKAAQNPFAEHGVGDKYWAQRFRLFSRFDQGVRLDPEGWFSVTPELVAKHIARRLAQRAIWHMESKSRRRSCDAMRGCDRSRNCNDDGAYPNTCSEFLVLDCFCGVGGNAIAMAQCAALKVVAIDVSPTRIDMARHNAAIYGVSDRITFVVADSLSVLVSLRTNGLLALPPSVSVRRWHVSDVVIFLAPPWGGPGYLTEEAFDVRSMEVCGSIAGDWGSECPRSVNGIELLFLARGVTPHVAYLLPRNVSLAQIASHSPPGGCEVESHMINSKLKTRAAYFGDLIGAHQAFSM